MVKYKNGLIDVLNTQKRTSILHSSSLVFVQLRCKGWSIEETCFCLFFGTCIVK